MDDSPYYLCFVAANGYIRYSLAADFCSSFRAVILKLSYSIIGI